MIDIPTLTTERLLLRAFRESDFEEYAQLCADPEVMRYLGQGGVLSRADAWRQMASFLGHWELRGYGIWAIEDRTSGVFIGRTGFWNPEGWPGFELGWTLARKWWGHGYATEAAARALQFGFDELKRDHVISVIHPDNRASMRVAERLGEQLEGDTEIFNQALKIYGIHRSK